MTKLTSTSYNDISAMHNTGIHHWISEHEEFTEEQSIIDVNDNACERW